MKFNFTYQTASDGSPSVSQEQMAAFETAGHIWSTYLTDNIEVNVHVGVANNLPTNVIGGALPAIKANQTSWNFASHLRDDETSQDDQTATDNLRDNVIAEDMIVWDTGETNLTTANAKAIGMVSAQDTALDGVILLSDLSNLSINNQPSSGKKVAWGMAGSATTSNSPNTLDLVSVALHELGHILGFVSGVDDAGWYQEVSTLQNRVNQGRLHTQRFRNWGYQLVQVFGEWSFGADSRMMPLDYFRYSDNSSFWGANDLSAGVNAYFSLDGGYTSIADFSTSKYGDGDGYQASHWKNADNAKGIMNPTLDVNKRNSISTIDLRAFDVMGWDLASSLLGGDGKISQYELQQTLDLSNSLTLTNLWNAAKTYVQQNQSSLVSDRTADVFQMIENSQVYEGKRKNGGSDGSWQELWQEITDVFAQEASFSTFTFESLGTGTSTPNITGTVTPPFLEFLTESQGMALNGLSQDLASTHAVWTPQEIKGGKANDDLLGSSAQDWLSGGQGEDYIRGKKGDDLLRGGNHRDVLRGGIGADIFVVQNKKSFDVVRDFTASEDMLKLGNQLSFEDLSLIQQGNHTLIQRDDSLLMVLKNVNAETVSLADIA